MLQYTKIKKAFLFIEIRESRNLFLSKSLNDICRYNMLSIQQILIGSFYVMNIK